MVKTLVGFVSKLAFAAVLSSLVASAGRAHEVLPTIADMIVADGQVTISMNANIEAFLAEIDLDEVQDTNNAPNAETYDTLRALPAEELATRADVVLARWNAAPLVTAGGQVVALATVSVNVPEDVNMEQPRISQWIFQGPIPQGAETIQVAWPRGAGALVLRQQGVEEPYTGYLEGGQASPEIALQGGGQQSAAEAFVGYIPVGFDHILPKGLDHILFVLGLFFLSTHLRPLIWQVSAFTAAHTVTLALGALGIVSIPGSIVEPLIAASITYVAIENVFSSGLSRWRPLVIFGFGLLHGLGFASVLGEFGLPEDQFIPALLGFNIGVEFGQLTVIAVMALCVWQALRVCRGEADAQGAAILYAGLTVLFLILCVVPMPNVQNVLEGHVALFAIPLALVFVACLLTVRFRPTLAGYRQFMSVPASAAIAAIGAYWFVERAFL